MKTRETLLLRTYVKPEISILEFDFESAILNSSNPTGSIPDMPWEKSSNEDMFWDESSLWK